MSFSAIKCKWILSIAGLMLPVAIFFAIQLNGDNINLHKWIPEGTEQEEGYQQFVDLFGEDDELIVSWPGCDLEDPRLEELYHRLSASPEGEKLFSSIVSGKTILDQMADKEFSFPRAQLKQRLQGVFFDDDSETTAIILQLSPEGKMRGQSCIAELNRQIELTEELTVEDARIGGNLYTNNQIDKATSQSLRYSFPAILLAIIFTYFCLRSVKLSVAALITAGSSGLFSISIISMSGSDFNGLLVITPILIMVLVLSATVHLSSYYRRALKDGDDDAVDSMIRFGFRPCILAVMTTAIGIIMLYTSHVQAARMFGVYTAVGLIASLACILLLFPALVRLLPFGKVSAGDRETVLASSTTERVATVATPATQSPRLALPIAIGIIVLSMASFPLLGEGLRKIKTELDPEQMFSEDSIVQRNSQWLSQKFSSVECAEVIATFDGGLDEANLVDQIRQLGALQAKLSRLPEIVTTFSIFNVCKMPKGARTASRHVQDNMTNEALIADFKQLETRRIAASTDDSVNWRIRLHFHSDQQDELPALMESIEATANEVASTLPAQPKILVTGIWPMIASGRQQMFSDLSRSFLLAFLIITPLIMLLVRGVLAGLIAMIPNVLPALTFFGTVGWLEIPVDIGMILTACVGLGIAVDDTLHFLQEYYRNLEEQSTDRFAATIRTVKHCIRPMTFTTLICSAGLLVFVFSEFLPAHNFAIAIVVLLVLALACDVLVLPALIISPLGRYFDRNTPMFTAAKHVDTESR